MYLRCFSVQQGDGSGNFSSVWLGDRKLVSEVSYEDELGIDTDLLHTGKIEKS